MSINRRLLFAGTAGLVLAGCSDIISPPPSSKLYVLKPKLPGKLQGPPVTWALAIQLPAGGGGLDSDRIAILRPPASLDYYAGTAWADPLPQLVQQNVMEAFETSGRIASVSRDSDANLVDLILGLDLRDFEARYDQGEGAPLAVVRLGARAIQARSRKIAGYTEFTKEVRASANSIDAAVEALTDAFAGVLTDLVPWVLNQSPPS